MSSDIKCSFFGHRNVEVTDELEQKVKDIVEDLIVNYNVQTFLFGSRSDFDDLCHSIVTDLKEKYPIIKRICYTSRSQACFLESERAYWEKVLSRNFKREVHILGFEEEFEHKTKYTAGKANYVERNQAMINDSDYCIFYYNENYQPEMRKYSKRCISYYQPKSGTHIAYNYAKQKKKTIINVLQPPW